MSQEILLSRDDAVATVTFNRPEQRNAISYDMWLELGRLANELSADESVHVVVFRGAGDEAFSAGADIKDFSERRYDSQSASKYADAFEGALDAIQLMDKPTISMIQGFCVGGGLELATATDIRIIARGATFGIPVARLGIVAGFREMRRIVSLIGPGQAAYLVLSGELIDAGEAYRIGLITRLVEPSALVREVYDLAQKMAELAPISHADHKAIIRTVLEHPGLDGMGPGELALQFRVFDSADFKEGMAAFLEKRKPRFMGR